MPVLICFGWDCAAWYTALTAQDEATSGWWRADQGRDKACTSKGAHKGKQAERQVEKRHSDDLLPPGALASTDQESRPKGDCAQTCPLFGMSCATHTHTLLSLIPQSKEEEHFGMYIPCTPMEGFAQMQRRSLRTRKDGRNSKDQ